MLRGSSIEREGAERPKRAGKLVNFDETLIELRMIGDLSSKVARMQHPTHAAPRLRVSELNHKRQKRRLQIAGFLMRY